jgi:CBS domain-containing protein
MPSPEDIDTPPLWTAIVPVALAGLVGAWFAARRRRAMAPQPRRLREIMTRTVEVVRPEATIFEASTMMRRLGVGFLPVCDGRRLQGTLTDRDVVMRTVAESRDPQVATVSEAMSGEVVYAFEDDTVERAAALMRQHQIRRLPIVDRARNLVGVVSLGDLAVEADDDQLSGSTLERISEPVRR